MSSNRTVSSHTAESPFGLLRLPGNVAFGTGAIDSIGEVTAVFGRRVFVCADPFIASTKNYRQAAESIAAAGLTVETFTDVVPELPVDAVRRAGGVARRFAPDVIVGFGGGSAMDLAKLVALLVRTTRRSPPSTARTGCRARVPVVAVPTTAGTGSEVTPVAVVDDPGRELKVGVSSPWLIPRAPIVDPVLGVMPRRRSPRTPASTPSCTRSRRSPRPAGSRVGRSTAGVRRAQQVQLAARPGGDTGDRRKPAGGGDRAGELSPRVAMA